MYGGTQGNEIVVTKVYDFTLLLHNHFLIHCVMRIKAIYGDFHPNRNVSLFENDMSAKELIFSCDVKDRRINEPTNGAISLQLIHWVLIKGFADIRF